MTNVGKVALQTPSKFIYLLLVFAVCLGQIPCFADPLTLVTVENSADTPISEAILTAAYRKLGIELVIKRYPAERAIRMAAAGQVDGEVQRIDAVRVHYPSLIQRVAGDLNRYHHILGCSNNRVVEASGLVAVDDW